MLVLPRPPALLVLLALLPPAAPISACPPAPLAAANAAWRQRADQAPGDGRARPEPIDRAIAGYERALEADPECLAAHWKLLQALYFAGDLASHDDAERRARFDRGADVSRRAVAVLAARAGGSEAAFDPDALRARLPADSISDAARIHFWSAVAWGAWGRLHGLLDAVREGVANRIRDHTLVALALEPDYEAGGPHRMLATLHAELPRVPLLTGWVDRSRALSEAERALAVAPDEPGNRLLFAITLLAVAPERRAEALAALAEVAALEPRRDRLVEDQALRRAARERLTRERAG